MAKKPLYFTEVETAWKIFVANKKLIPLMVLIDLLFYYFLTRIQMEIFVRVGENIKAASSVIQSQVESLSQAELAQLNKFLLQNPEFVSQYHQIIKYLGLFFLLTLLIWIVLKGANWFLTHKMFNKKIRLKDFAQRFVLTSLFWFILFIVIIAFLSKFISSTAVTIFSTLSPETTMFISSVVLLFAAYFALISFSMLLEKKLIKNTFSFGLKKIKEVMPAYILVLILMFVIATLPITLFKINYWLSLAFIMIISLPSLTLGRIYFFSVVEKAMKK